MLSSDESKPSALPQNWNAGNGNYGFRYSHSQSSMQYLVKINRLGAKTVVMALGVGDDKTTSFDIVTKDYTSESFFPYTKSEDASRRRLEDGFISENRIADLASLVKINIVQKLIPGLSKPGYEEDHIAGAAASAGERRSARPDDEYQPHPEFGSMGVPRPYGDFPQAGPRPLPDGGERPPGFDDEYGVFQRPRGFGYPQGGRNPLSIGADDLNPPGLGPNPLLRGPFFGEGGNGMGGIGGGMGGMGGMHPSPDHPMFGGRGGGGPYGDLR